MPESRWVAKYCLVKRFPFVSKQCRWSKQVTLKAKAFDMGLQVLSRVTYGCQCFRVNIGETGKKPIGIARHENDLIAISGDINAVVTLPASLDWREIHFNHHNANMVCSIGYWERVVVASLSWCRAECKVGTLFTLNRILKVGSERKILPTNEWGRFQLLEAIVLP